MMSDSVNKRQKLDRKIDIADRVSPQLVGADIGVDLVLAPDGFLRPADRGEARVETHFQDQPHQDCESGPDRQLQVQ